MKRAALALALVVAGAPALADDSGTLTGSTEILYSCDMTFPGGNIDMSDRTGLTEASGETTFPFEQNAGTTYTLTQVSIDAEPTPAGSIVVGTITFRDGNDNIVVTADSTGAPTPGTFNGIVSQNGSILASVSDSGVLEPGTYTISSTLSCSETP